jgi:hypothetical protein
MDEEKFDAVAAVAHAILKYDQNQGLDTEAYDQLSGGDYYRGLVNAVFAAFRERPLAEFAEFIRACGYDVWPAFTAPGNVAIPAWDESSSPPAVPVLVVSADQVGRSLDVAAPEGSE